jgi:UDP-glucose 4-epimerase
MAIKNRRIIVTGGAGFIGTNLVESIAKHNEVVVLDNMYTGKAENLKDAVVKYGVKIVRGNSGKVEAAMKRPDLIFHLGMYSSAPMYKGHNEYLADVVRDGVELFRYAAANDIGVAFASTSSIYNGHRPPHRETMVPIVTDFYTEARIAIERLAELYCKMCGLNAIGLRFFSVYGPHEESKGNYANLVSQFIWEAMRGKQPVVYGDGTQARDYIYVADVIDALTKAAERTKGYDMVNVGTGRSYSVNEMIKRLAIASGCEIRPKYVRNPVKNYVQITKADTSKAKKVIGFSAKYTLDRGLRETVRYYKQLGQWY